MRFFSRGKLLISGEYLVLKGAEALAVPLVKGQELKIIRTGKPGELQWESKERGSTWFEASFTVPFFEVIRTSDDSIAKNLARHFAVMVEMNPGFITEMDGATLVSDLEFMREWGFGSSSSLLSNLAYWAGVDPFSMHRKISSGSGYDVVCAREEGPIFFRLNKQKFVVKKARLDPRITPYIHFVYLGKKEDSSIHVDAFLASKKAFPTEKKMVSELGRHMASASTIEDFEYYMKEHEEVMASILKMPTLKEGTFSDLPGEAKSLGAWGGDFAMVTWTDAPFELEKYLHAKGLSTSFSFNDLIKTR
jgi:mevalonate kinase